MVVKKAAKKSTKAKTEKKTPAPVKKQAPPKDIEERTDHGVIKIHEDVIGDVVKQAVDSLNKVCRLEEGSFIDNIAGMVGSGKGAIAIDMGESSVNVALKINVLYGNNISTVATKVQATIKQEIKSITSLNTGRIDVFVQKLIKEPTPAEKKAATKK